MRRILKIGVLSAAFLLATVPTAHSGDDKPAKGHKPDREISRVLLISIDGMPAVDLANRMKGVGGLAPYCPNLAKLAGSGLFYPQASCSRPSDSFPGLLAMVTGGTPFSAEVFYDDSYDRVLAPP